MNLDKKRSELLKANKGSKLFYDSQNEEYVIIIKAGEGLLITADCDFCSGKIYKKNSDKLICRVQRD